MNTTPDAPPILTDETKPPILDAPKRPKGAFQRAWSAFLAFLAAVWKFALPVFKLAKGAKVLLTAGTMLLSVWFYSLTFGWSFAAGFVVCILIHEIGHLCADWALGIPVSAPIFIPGMGALILSKRMGRSAWESAVMGYGGPLFGTLAAVGCWAIYGLGGSPLFLGLALIGFMMNLFNMIPVFPLDGGWITGAISPYIWVLGLIGLVGLAVFGVVHSPFVWVLVLLSLPRMLGAFKTGTLDQEKRTTGGQRLVAGLAYVALCGFLVWGISRTHDGMVAIRHARAPRTAVQ